MADHVAEQIFAVALAALTGLATTGSSVRASPVDPATAFPVLDVDQGDETIETEDPFGDALLERSMDLVVTANVKLATGYREQINTIRKEVEVALAGADWPGTAATAVPTGCVLEKSGEAEKQCMQATLTFSVWYHTNQSAPDVAL